MADEKKDDFINERSFLLELIHTSSIVNSNEIEIMNNKIELLNAKNQELNLKLLNAIKDKAKINEVLNQTLNKLHDEKNPKIIFTTLLNLAKDARKKVDDHKLKIHEQKNENKMVLDEMIKSLDEGLNPNKTDLEIQIQRENKNVLNIIMEHQEKNKTVLNEIMERQTKNIKKLETKLKLLEIKANIAESFLPAVNPLLWDNYPHDEQGYIIDVESDTESIESN
jgi:hypothetical protein